jgi:hypothetical protein
MDELACPPHRVTHIGVLEYVIQDDDRCDHCGRTFKELKDEYERQADSATGD